MAQPVCKAHYMRVFICAGVALTSATLACFGAGLFFIQNPTYLPAAGPVRSFAAEDINERARAMDGITSNHGHLNNEVSLSQTQGSLRNLTSRSAVHSYHNQNL